MINKLVKPHAPKKPLKNALPPSQYNNVEKILMVNKNNQLELVSIYYHESYNEKEDCIQWEIDGYENFGERLFYSDIEQIRKLVPSTIKNFEIEQIHNRDGYYEYTVISYKEKIDSETYQLYLDKYNNRFKIYQEEYLKYQKELKKYEEAKTQARIERAELELKKLKNS